MKALLAVLILLASTIASFADCTTPAGYTRWGSGYWRISETMPSAPSWERLPSSVPGDISQTIKDLGRNSTGIAIHVQSSTDILRLCWVTATGTAAYPLISQTAASGIDVYYRSAATDNEWRWLSVGEAIAASDNVQSIALGSSEAREFLIYLPQYRRITTVRIEAPSAYSVSAGPTPTDDPLVIFGSSIVQGTGTSRAGIAYPQALGRYYDRDSINLGFAGSCQMFDGMATLLATIDASAFIIDCFPNMTAAQISSQMPTFMATLLAGIPSAVPVYIAQDRLNQAGGPHPDMIARQADNYAAAYPIYQTLALTHPNLHWIPATDLLGDDYEATVDGSHPSDLGHRRYFEALRDAIGAL